MNLILGSLIAICCQLPEGEAPQPAKEEWNHVVLWKDDVLSARLLFKPQVSLADQGWIELELHNQTQQPIELSQTWVHLWTPGSPEDDPHPNCRIGLSGVMPSLKKVPPGRHRYGGGPLEFASVSNSCTADKVPIELRVKISMETADGRTFATAKEAAFSIEWHQPTAEQLRKMSEELKRRFGAQEIPYEDYARITTLLKAPMVVKSLTVEDYLSALKTRHWSLRYELLPYLFAKHADDPKVLEYYREMFKQEPDFISHDAISPAAWNDEFLEPLVRGCERGKWTYFAGLTRHVPKWRDNEMVVSRVSAALLEHHAILRRDIDKIKESELDTWSRAVWDASNVPDPKLVKLLQPALDDHRNANVDLGSGGINEARVCDRALDAILTILDGDPWITFKAAGISGWKTREEGEAAYDRVIDIVKARLKAAPGSGQPGAGR